MKIKRATAKAVSAYLGANIYNQARVSRVVFKGIQGKTVKTVYLLNPDIPGMIN